MRGLLMVIVAENCCQFKQQHVRKLVQRCTTQAGCVKMEFNLLTMRRIWLGAPDNSLVICLCFRSSRPCKQKRRGESTAVRMEGHQRKR